MSKPRSAATMNWSKQSSGRYGHVRPRPARLTGPQHLWAAGIDNDVLRSGVSKLETRRAGTSTSAYRHRGGRAGALAAPHGLNAGSWSNKIRYLEEPGGEVYCLRRQFPLVPPNGIQAEFEKGVSQTGLPARGILDLLVASRPERETCELRGLPGATERLEARPHMRATSGSSSSLRINSARASCQTPTQAVHPRGRDRIDAGAAMMEGSIPEGGRVHDTAFHTERGSRFPFA